jgi:hypothetical protein
MADPNLGQVAASVWSNVVGAKPTDNIRGSLAFFKLLGESGFKEDVGGGLTFDFSLEYANNPSHVSVGEFDLIDTTRYDTFDAAQFSWKIVAGSVVYSELERLRAAASSGKFDVIADKLENGKESHMAAMNVMLFGDGTGNGGKDVDGMSKLVPTAPTTGTVGSINRATWTWWRSQTTAGTKSSTAFDNLRSAFRSTYNKCSRGGTAETPTACLTSRTVMEGYEGTMIANERYLMEARQRGANGGLDNNSLMFKSAEVMYDEDCSPSDSAYFFSPKNLKLVYLRGGWMKLYPAVDPANMLSNVHKLATFCNLGTNNSRRLGVVYTIT